MVTLNQSLHQTSHQSPLVRKAARHGLYDVESLIHLAVLRGCRHYQNTVSDRSVCDLGQEELSDDELSILLLHGNYRYEPMAVRCAAQLLKSSFISPRHAAFLAIQERCEIPLRYIATLALDQDKEDPSQWAEILEVLGNQSEPPVEGVLPHVSRFMVNAGIHRGKIIPPQWLQPIR